MTTTIAREFLAAIHNATVQLEIASTMLESHHEAAIKIFSIPNDKPSADAIIAKNLKDSAEALDAVRYFFLEIVNNIPEGAIARANKVFFSFEEK